MSAEIVKFKDHMKTKSPKESAVDWLVKIDAVDTLTEVDRHAFHQWYNENEANKKAFLELKAFWANQTLTDLLPQVVERKAQIVNSRQGELSRNKWWRNPVAATALLMMMFFAGFSMLQPNETIIDERHTYTTAVGQQSHFTLADNSTLQLNANSKVQVQYTEDARNIYLLHGEAFFEVTKEPHRPFRVYAGSGRVQAIGTAFNVRLRNKEVEVLVTEGRVALASSRENSPINSTSSLKGNEIQLETLGFLDAGQWAKMNSDIPPVNFDAQRLQIGENEIQRRQAWRDGWLEFTGQPLSEVIEDISPFTHNQYVLSSQAVGKVKIGGRYQIKDVDNIPQELKSQFGLTVTQTGYHEFTIGLSED